MHPNSESIPVVSVSYNSPELIEDLLSSFRAHYKNPITIIDGSSGEFSGQIEEVCKKYADVQFIHFEYNIHHGPGMAWAFQNLFLSGPVLVIDSDVFILRHGFIENMLAALKPDMYGVGTICYVNDGGYHVEYREGAVRYLHPACMLCNAEVVRQWPMPTKHGAPLTDAMLAIHRSGNHALLGEIEWLTADFSSTPAQTFLRHDWQGTVKRTGGYHLEEWEKAAKQLATVRLLAQSLIPLTAQTVIEIGANDGSLARSYKGVNPSSEYIGLSTAAEPQHLEVGARDRVVRLDAYNPTLEAVSDFPEVDCWVLDQILERIANPEQLLASIRELIAKDGCVVAVIPNAQHWTIQAKLCIGDFRYSSSGLMNSNNLRWFTRATIFELFQKTGFTVVQGYPVIHEKLENPKIVEAIKQFSDSVGGQASLSADDAQAVQYIIKAVPS